MRSQLKIEESDVPDAVNVDQGLSDSSVTGPNVLEINRRRLVYDGVNLIMHNADVAKADDNIHDFQIGKPLAYS